MEIAFLGGVAEVSRESLPGIVRSVGAVEHKYMEHAQRIQTYDDELHERRRHLAVVRTAIDFQAERLKRLVEKARETRDP